jgi:hypothetical protein
MRETKRLNFDETPAALMRLPASWFAQRYIFAKTGYGNLARDAKQFR